MPGDALKKAINRRRNADGKLSITVIPDIAKQFGVSTDALLWRIHWLYNFGQQRADETHDLIEKVKRLNTSSRVFDEKEDKPTKYPERYRMLATQSLRGGELSIGRFMEYTEMNRREAMNYYEQEDEVLGEVQLTAV